MRKIGAASLLALRPTGSFTALRTSKGIIERRVLPWMERLLLRLATRPCPRPRRPTRQRPPARGVYAAVALGSRRPAMPSSSSGRCTARPPRDGREGRRAR